MSLSFVGFPRTSGLCVDHMFITVVQLKPLDASARIFSHTFESPQDGTNCDPSSDQSLNGDSGIAIEDGLMCVRISNFEEFLRKDFCTTQCQGTPSPRSSKGTCYDLLEDRAQRSGFANCVARLPGGRSALRCCRRGRLFVAARSGRTLGV